MFLLLSVVRLHIRFMRPGVRHHDGGWGVVGGWSVTILGGGGVGVVWGHSKHCIVWRFKASF